MPAFAAFTRRAALPGHHPGDTVVPRHARITPGPGYHAGPRFGTQAPRTVLRRPLQGRMVAGVAAGVARHVGVDVMTVRVALVVLALFGGAGIPLYLAGLLLIPEEGGEEPIASREVAGPYPPHPGVG